MTRWPLLLILACGCGAPVQYGTVSGLVTIGGTPAPGVRVEFIPDVDRGSTGFSAVAETDDAGRYTLITHDPKVPTPVTGAVVGWHRVVLLDVKASQSGGGAGSMILRVPPDYMSVSSTTVSHEVRPGEQTIDIKIPGAP